MTEDQIQLDPNLVEDEEQQDDEQFMETLDPAQQSLNDALRFSFLILKGLMLVLVLLYAVSGTFTVPEGKRAVRLRFGEIVNGGTDEAVLSPGGFYFTFPYPIDEVILVPDRQNTIAMVRQFMAGGALNPEIAAQRANEGRSYALDPNSDGYLLTGDFNIMHAQWSMTYEIEDPLKYVTNVGDEALAEQLVLAAVEQGIVHATAKAEVEQFLKGSFNADEVRSVTRRVLEGMETGIVVRDISMTEKLPPASVIRHFNAVNQAEAGKARAIQAALETRASTLTEVAGEAHGPLWNIVREYEQATEYGEAEDLAELAGRLNRAFDELLVTGEDEVGYRIGGRVARVINRAKTYRTTIVDEIGSEASVFAKQLPAYNDNPRLLESRLWTKAKINIFAGETETFFVPSKTTVRLKVGRDPELKSEREAKQLKEIRAIRSAPATDEDE